MDEPRQRQRLQRSDGNAHKKPLAVAIDVVRAQVRRLDGKIMQREQRPRRPGIEVWTRTRVDRHQRAVGTDVEEFLAVAAPSRIGSASNRHLPFLSLVQQRLHVDVEPAGHVGRVSEPAAVR